MGKVSEHAVNVFTRILMILKFLSEVLRLFSEKTLRKINAARNI